MKDKLFLDMDVALDTNLLLDLAGKKDFAQGFKETSTNWSHALCLSGSPTKNPKGIPASSPGLRGTSYPGKVIGRPTTPTGLRPGGRGVTQPRWDCREFGNAVNRVRSPLPR